MQVTGVDALTPFGAFGIIQSWLFIIIHDLVWSGFATFLFKIADESLPNRLLFRDGSFAAIAIACQPSILGLASR